MLKNTVPSREYVLASARVRDLAGDALATATPHRETLDGIGETTLWLAAPAALPRLQERPPRPIEPAAEVRRENTFHPLPGKARGGLSKIFASVWARLSGA